MTASASDSQTGALGRPPAADLGRHLPAAAGLLALAGVAWWLSAGRMQGMDMPGMGLGSLGWFAATWVLMMAAMMLPAVAPAVVSTCFTRRTSPRAVPAAAAFLLGYLAVWALAGVAVWLVLDAGRALAGGALEWRHSGRWLASAILGAAVVYQLSATKRRWLVRCRAPLTRPDGRPVRDLAQGGRAGLHAGLRCLASSWALMAVLFALGAMSLVWMGVVAVLIIAERLAPLTWPARGAAAGVLLMLAVAVAAVPGALPG